MFYTALRLYLFPITGDSCQKTVCVHMLKMLFSHSCALQEEVFKALRKAKSSQFKHF